MKLTLIGGGGVRAPLFVLSALKRAQSLGLEELWLLDLPESRLDVIGALSFELAAQHADRPVRIRTSTDPVEALSGADYVVTTIRPGGIDGRIRDERIALDLGVLGQETTGAGGFAMALRSIPQILGYAELMRQHCPQAWLLNFTNPAGLVTQALHDVGYTRAIGICDSANGAQRAVAKFLGRPDSDVEAEVFGLNHLSFTRSAKVDGENVLPRLLASDAFLKSSAQRVFDPELVRHQGMWLNEYLYYFYYADEAVASLRAGVTRGEEIKALNQNLIPDLLAANVLTHPASALDVYFGYEHRRSASYMAKANKSGEADAVPVAEEDDGEGYAGVALGIIVALNGGAHIRTGLNTCNNGTIAELADTDVVEVSCIVDQAGLHPVPVEPLPPLQAPLIHTIKTYERLTVEAILNRDRAKAVDALMVHPLVQSYPRAKALVSSYLEAHAAFIPNWGQP